MYRRGISPFPLCFQPLFAPRSRKLLRENELQAGLAHVPAWSDCQKGSATTGEKEKYALILFSKEKEEVILPDDASIMLLNVWPELNKCHL